MVKVQTFSVDLLADTVEQQLIMDEITNEFRQYIHEQDISKANLVEFMKPGLDKNFDDITHTDVALSPMPFNVVFNDDGMGMLKFTDKLKSMFWFEIYRITAERYLDSYDIHNVTDKQIESFVKSAITLVENVKVVDVKYNQSKVFSMLNKLLYGFKNYAKAQ